MPYFTSPNTNDNNNNVPASSSQEDQAKAQKQQQRAASVQPKHHELPRTEAPTVLRSPSKQEAEYSRDNEINSRRGTSTDEHSMHKGASVQSKHHELPRTEAPTVLRLPSKQEDDHSSWDNEIIARGTTHEHPEHKEVGHVPARIPSKDQQPAKNFDGVKEQSRIEYQERKEADMPAKDQAPLTSLRQQEHDRPKDNGGVTNRPADPPVNNNPIININVYLTDHQQPKSVDKNDAIKENNVKPANNLEKKTDAESSCCERCKKLCSIL